jgi:ACS family tartrate transporter-like MFS transporter
VLGLAEAGFYPGILLYLTWWFPSYYRSRMIAIFMSAMTGSQIIGPPVSAFLLTLDGWFGLQGWQILFLLEAVPTLVMSVIFWFYLTDHPRDATWLRPDQREWLQARLDSEVAQREAVRRYSVIQTLLNPRVWLFTTAYFGYSSANSVINVFLPQIVRSFGISIQMTGFVAALPFVCGLGAMIYWSRRSDRSGSRTLYASSAALTIAVGLAVGSLIGISHPVFMMLAMTIGIMGISSFAATFWPIPQAMLSGFAAAGGVAFINSVGNVSGLVAPTIYGLIKDATGSNNQLALLVVAAAPVVSALVLVALGHDRRLERIPRA